MQMNSGAGVAPLAGAWIEIKLSEAGVNNADDVAPLAGAWIEIDAMDKLAFDGIMSLPSRERGLKSDY